MQQRSSQKQEISSPRPAAEGTAILEFYRRPGGLTSPGRFTALFDELPGDVAALVRTVQGLVLHQYMAKAYGVTLSAERAGECHIRSVERMLECLLAHDGRPLATSRPAERRLAGVCSHFTSLVTAMLRARGVPARARSGFGDYFNPGYHEEHILCEYWHAAEARWVRVDTQLDEVWHRQLHVDFDPLDVPPDRFLGAGEAWARCRAGVADPAQFGIFVGDLRGLWFVAGELVRDLAALNRMELLPWDVWGAMPRPGQPLADDQLAFFDQLASLSRAPDPAFARLRGRYEADDRLRVPATVFNAVRNRPESI